MRRTTKKRKLTRKAPRGAKKPSKKRKVSAVKYHNHRYEHEGSCNAGVGKPYMYVGLNDCYKRGAIWDAMADALLRPILAKECKFYPLQDTDTIGNTGSGAKQTLVFDMKRVSGTTGVEQVVLGLSVALPNQRVDLDNTTYDAMRGQMSTMLRTYADGNAGINPASDSVAYFPCRYHMCSSTSTVPSVMVEAVVSTFDHVGDTMIDVNFAQKTVFSNRTLAQDGGAAGEFTDRLGTNPIKGKTYQFNHSNPRILDHVDMSTALRSSIQSDEQTYGIAKYTSVSSEDLHLAHPLAANFGSRIV